ncbi:MAG: hypothetical protein U5K37_05210 [Natrialbaceae archaeon]|nr:hypothetical protein [Natrialbaceae archaeon]
MPPGMLNLAIELGEKVRADYELRDGLYGGQFVEGMYAAVAFLKRIPEWVVKDSNAFPRQVNMQITHSRYDPVVRTVTDDRQVTREKINRKYHLNPAYRKFSCSGPDSDFNIDANINGADIVGNRPVRAE